MKMAASIVEYTVHPEHAEELHARVRQHIVPAARRVTGYQGLLLLDRGEGKRVAILLYDSADAVRAAQEALTQVGRARVYALMSGPALGSLATVIIGDGVFAEPARR